MEAFDFHSQETDFLHSGVSNDGVVKAKDQAMMSNPQIFNLDPELSSLDEEVQSNYVAETSCYSCLDNQVLDENKKEDGDMSMLSSPQVSIGDFVISNATSIPPPKEEHTCSNDVDTCQISDQCNGSISSDFVVSDVVGTDKMNRIVDTNCNSHSSPESSTTKSDLDDILEFRQTCPIVIPVNKAAREEVDLLTGSLPKMSSHSNSLNKHDISHPLSQSLDSNWTSPTKNYLKRLKSNGDKENGLLDEELGDKENHSFTYFKSTVMNPPIGKTTYIRTCKNAVAKAPLYLIIS